MKKILNTICKSVLFLSCILTFLSCSDADSVVSKYPVPSISDFYPKEGLPTSIVTIKGSEFGTERTDRIGRVYFGGVEATEYESWSDNEIKVKVPAGGKTGNITLWVWKNHTETEEEFTCVPGAEITSINPSPTFPGSQVTITGKNFQYFLDKGLTAADVSVEFCSENGVTIAKADAVTANTVTVTVPLDAKGGNVSVTFGDFQKVEGPELPLIGDLKLSLGDYVEVSGTISAAADGIGSTKNGAYVIYKFDAPTTGLFDSYLTWGSTKDGSSLNLDISEDLNALKTSPMNDKLTRQMKNTGSWNTTQKESWGAFYLKEGKTYYMKVTFLSTGSSWVGNVGEIGLTLSADQNQVPINGQGGGRADYTLYQNDFNSSSSYAPFRDAWAWSPNYIEVKNKYLEFYYNHKALEENNVRQRRGCEITCDFSTPTEGWYGFKFYLPEGKFPMDQGGIIIAQLFNGGCKNSWAGHLSIDKGNVQLSYRNALVDPKVGTVGKVTTGKWYSAVLYFKVGRNNKGRLKVWLGDNLVENNPTYDSGACNFGFGHWIDDETLDNSGSNQDCINASSYGGKDAIGCKFGLYVSNPVDITIRMDDIKALEGNPEGSFSLVCPK